MALEIIMPQLGLSMDKGRIARWVKQEGDQIKQGDVILEIESDKSIVEVEAVADGFLHILNKPDDGEIEVGRVIGFILKEGEKPPEKPTKDEQTSAESQTISHGTKQILDGKETEDQVGSKRERIPVTPKARRKARELGVNLQLAVPTGTRGQITEKDVLELVKRLTSENSQSEIQHTEKEIEEGKIDITPVARRLAEEKSIDILALAKAFPGKRIGKADVERFLQNQKHESVSSLTSTLSPNTQKDSALYPPVLLKEEHQILPAYRKPISSTRALIAKRMNASARTYTPVTLMTKADATQLVWIRTSLKNKRKDGLVPSYNVLLAILVAHALKEHRDLNATLNGEEIIYWETINIGIAVDSPRGLLVPVLRNVSQKTLVELSQEAQEILTRAANGKSKPDELSGSTFTITNLGVQDIDFFTPIINPPECAVLGVGRMKKEMVFDEHDNGVVRIMLPLSLTFDHRLVDGAPAARFLKQVKQYVENPIPWLLP